MSFALPVLVKENVAVVKCALDAETAVMRRCRDNSGDHTHGDPKRQIQQLSMADLDSIHSPSINFIVFLAPSKNSMKDFDGKVRPSYNFNRMNPEMNCRTRNGVSNSCVKN